MGEAYFNLKRKLEDLGYNDLLPVDGVSLVECILADLLQTTRSLQHYMELSKEALMQRDSLLLEAEPYKCDNAKLIQENNQLHKENIKLKEENFKIVKELARKSTKLSEELMKKDALITKLQQELREVSLRGLCAETLSSRNKSKRKDSGDIPIRMCTCIENSDDNSSNSDLNRLIQTLEEQIREFKDEIALLRNQVEYRDSEILRLNILLQGGRPINALNKDCCRPSNDSKVKNLLKQLRDLESANYLLKSDVEIGIDKQHEAMKRALDLADKNKALQEEIKKVDTLALRVEEDCNKKISEMMNEVNNLQTRIEVLIMRNSELEAQVTQQTTKGSVPHKFEESFLSTLKENENLHKEIRELTILNKTLESRLHTPTQHSKDTESVATVKCPTTGELRELLGKERLKYEKHISGLEEKLDETMKLFNKHMSRCKDGVRSPRSKSPAGTSFVRNLHQKICESEQNMLMLKKENDDLKSKLILQGDGDKQNYKDIITQLNVENSELSKENIALSQKLSQYKNIDSTKSYRSDYTKREVERLKDTITELTHEVQILKKDKNEYNLMYKEAVEKSEKLKRDLIHKQKEIESLEEENCSYKMTHRNGKASADHLKEECEFLKEQIRKMQTDVIKEKTLASQIKNIQLETERSSHEIQNELLSTQKKLSLAKDTIESLEKKCKELQSEINSIRGDKSNLIDNIRRVDQERDKMVIELDHKTENICVLEQKVKNQQYDICKLENTVAELTRKLNSSKVTEHKLVDNESQIAFLSGEITRLTQNLDTAAIENKHLQNNIADLSGTLKLTKIEYEKSRHEVDILKEQLQHYVAEIRRIEELLSHKEAERSDMLEHFASLSVEANILENTNQSLESESASKSAQLQSYVSKIDSLEAKLADKESVIENQSARIAAMSCKITSLENEVKLMTEEKTILEQNVAYLKQMCSNLQYEHNDNIKSMGNVDTELKMYENRIKSLTRVRSNLESEKDDLKETLLTTENLLSNTRKEVVELKLALQDATSETKSLQDRLTRRVDSEIRESTITREEYDLPITLEEIHEVSHEEDEDSTRYRSIHKKLSKYTHSTL